MNLWRKSMRASFVFAAVASVAVGFLGTPGANAMTGTSPAGVRVAAEAMDTSALVHCRPYRHMHPWQHHRSFGCRGGDSVEIRRGHRERIGVEERERSRTSIHSRTKTDESTKSSTGPGKTGETKSGTGTKPESSGRTHGGEKSSTGGSGGGSSGGTPGTQPSGQKQ
jgi:hypothetical protein